MATYDFSTLSPTDFELLVADLLRADLGVHVESFKTGRDQGIDLRYATYGSGPQWVATVVQCKHYVGTGFAGLKRAIKDIELAKIVNLNPARYRLATSVPLSPGNKAELLALLAPFVKSTEDVLGADELNALIRRHPEVERSHFKLWLGSAAVLQTILHSEIFSRTAVDAESVKRRFSLFVVTPAIARARNLLANFGFCLISGIPGIGKTTTAEMLMALALEDKWEVVVLNSGAREAFATFRADARQLFFFDDFLGRTSLLDNSIGKNEDRDLVRLLRVCKQSPSTKRAVLTTREYILEQARQASEVLSNLDLPRCTISLADYSQKARAEILINHLWFYKVSGEVRRYLVASGVAAKIIRHQHYSPRIVEWMCDSNPYLIDNPAGFAELFVRTLDDPSRLWQHAYESQISPVARQVVLGLASLGDNCEPEALLRTVVALCPNKEGLPEQSLAFRKALIELEGNFIRVETDGGISAVKFHNPSVKDFTDKLLLRDTALVAQVFSSGSHYEQLVRLLDRAIFPAQSVTEGMVLRKIAELHRANPAIVRDVATHGHRRIERVETRLSARLSRVLDLVAGRFYSLELAVAQFALEYLAQPDMQNDSATDAVELYFEAAGVLGSRQQTPRLRPEVLGKVLSGHLREAVDFASVARLADWPLRERITAAFVAFAADELEYIAAHVRSSDELGSQLDAIRVVAANLQVEHAIDFTHANGELDSLIQEEDAYAERYQDEHDEGHYGSYSDQRDADDILRALLE